MKNTTVIELNSVGKKYTIRHVKPALIDSFFNFNKKDFWALRDVSLQFKKGEKIGIIGHNGSGKTTFLKLIAGITQASSGNVKITGRVVSLIELTAGFHPDLSGRENIFLNGLLIGMSLEEIQKKTKSIIRFAELHQFIDSPVYTYSAGMSLRLSFSVAVHANPDILIMDEGIAVGDEYFQTKAKKKIQEFFKKNKTIIVASHWLEFIEDFCTKIVWLEKGGIRKVGGKELLVEYKKYMKNK